MKDDVFLKKLGNNIRKIRLSKKMTQVQLADMLDSEKSSINRIEAGRTNPTTTTLKKIAECLEVEIEVFFKF